MSAPKVSVRIPHNWLVVRKIRHPHIARGRCRPIHRWLPTQFGGLLFKRGYRANKAVEPLCVTMRLWRRANNSMKTECSIVETFRNSKGRPTRQNDAQSTSQMGTVVDVQFMPLYCQSGANLQWGKPVLRYQGVALPSGIYFTLCRVLWILPFGFFALNRSLSFPLSSVGRCRPEISTSGTSHVIQ